MSFFYALTQGCLYALLESSIRGKKLQARKCVFNLFKLRYISLVFLGPLLKVLNVFVPCF